MIVIRSQQIQQLRNAALLHFEQLMVIHLNHYAEQHCKVIGEEMVREVVRLGINRAEEYGFTCRGPVRFYLELMFNLGSHFDTDPQYPWAADTLNDQKINDQMGRSEILYNRAMDYFTKVAGPDNLYAQQALHKIFLSVQQLQPPLELLNVAQSIQTQLAQSYPQKYEYVGDEAFQKLIAEGVETSKAYQCGFPRGVYLVILLMITLGHGITDDPLYPWVKRTLKDPLISNSENRINRLEHKAITYLNHAIEYLAKRA